MQGGGSGRGGHGRGGGGRGGHLSPRGPRPSTAPESILPPLRADQVLGRVHLKAQGAHESIPTRGDRAGVDSREHHGEDTAMNKILIRAYKTLGVGEDILISELLEDWPAPSATQTAPRGVHPKSSLPAACLKV